MAVSSTTRKYSPDARARSPGADPGDTSTMKDIRCAGVFESWRAHSTGSGPCAAIALREPQSRIGPEEPTRRRSCRQRPGTTPKRPGPHTPAHTPFRRLVTHRASPAEGLGAAGRRRLLAAPRPPFLRGHATLAERRSANAAPFRRGSRPQREPRGDGFSPLPSPSPTEGDGWPQSSPSPCGARVASPPAPSPPPEGGSGGGGSTSRGGGGGYSSARRLNRTACASRHDGTRVRG